MKHQILTAVDNSQAEILTGEASTLPLDHWASIGNTTVPEKGKGTQFHH
jgi:hypothetical protein